MEAPTHKHDCDHCTFLGSMDNLYDPEKGLVDLYFHSHEDGYGSTFIARYSSEGGDYSSGFKFCWSNPHLNKALRMAHEKKMLHGSTLVLLEHEQGCWLNYCKEDTTYKEASDAWFNEMRFLLPTLL